MYLGEIFSCILPSELSQNCVWMYLSFLVTIRVKYPSLDNSRFFLSSSSACLASKALLKLLLSDLLNTDRLSWPTYSDWPWKLCIELWDDLEFEFQVFLREATLDFLNFFCELLLGSCCLLLLLIISLSLLSELTFSKFSTTTFPDFASWVC